ncbi:MAG TPA: CBS domain-containing protein [Rhizomicrobium sp.]|nr:CBS domain-containing protein [Rhizomicrobium sp.]
MLVEQVLSKACERLAIIDAAASIRDAANLMAEPHTNLVVVCRDGAAIGVVTKKDIVVEISQCAKFDLDAPVETVMTREVTHCLSSDPLADVWKTMKARNIQSVPVLDESGAPVGIVYARDALQCLLQEVETDDELVRDFISGVGYR